MSLIVQSFLGDLVSRLEFTEGCTRSRGQSSYRPDHDCNCTPIVDNSECGSDVGLMYVSNVVQVVLITFAVTLLRRAQ